MATFTPVNAINVASAGIVGFDGTATFVETAVTQYNVLLGGSTSSTIAQSAPGTAGIPLVSNGAAANPTFTTALVVGGGTGSTSFNINGTVISGTTTTSPLTALTMTNGQVIIGNTGNPPAAANITPGAGISITNAANSITIAATGSGMAWSDTSGTVTASINNGYFITATCTSTLPASPSEGDSVAYVVDTTNILTITANTGQKIRVGNQLSVAVGTCANNFRGDAIELTYRTSGTTWFARSVEGTWTLQLS